LLSIALLPVTTWSQIITTHFTVRIHTNICGYRWAKLWYLLRGIDRRGSGYCRLPLAEISHLLGAASSTIYEWLRLGEKVGAFRRWRVSGGVLSCAIGSLTRVTINLGLKNLGWGFTAEIPLHQILNLRAHATGIVAQKLQQRTRHKAWESLPNAVRANYKLPHASDIFQHAHRLSDNPPSGSIRCLLHVGKRRIFVSKGFIPFGANQNAIAYERDVSERTVRRHINKIQMEHRQLVQAKAAYRDVANAIEWTAENYEAEPGITVKCFDHLPFGSGILQEAPGGVGKPYLSQISSSRIFEYAGKTWLYRCNLYNPQFTLRTMAHRIRNYKRLLVEGGQVEVAKEFSLKNEGFEDGC
jgi:hypothetical protein